MVGLCYTTAKWKLKLDTMNRNEAESLVRTEYLFAYLLAGVVLTVIQLLDTKFRDKYKDKGFVVFLVQISKGIIPLSLITVLLGNHTLGVWFVAVVAIYIFVSPLYLIYWIFQKLSGKGKIKPKKQEKLFEDDPVTNLKQSQPKTIIWIIGILLAICLFGSLFYWYEIRPSEIRKSCDNYARNKYQTYDNYKAAYTACLHKEGLE